MTEFPIWHWILFAIVWIVVISSTIVSPIIGIVRSVKNGSVLHAVLSLIIPAYGHIYFLAAKRD